MQPKNWINHIRLYLRETNQIPKQLQQLHQFVKEMLTDQKKRLRRLDLMQQQQGETLQTLNQQLSLLGGTLTSQHPQNGVQLSYKSLLSILDKLEKIMLSQDDNTSTTAKLVSSTIDDCLTSCLWQPITQRDEAYPATGCQVIGAQPSDTIKPGHVLDIVQQGYIDRYGEVMRPAKVVIAQAALSNTTNTTTAFITPDTEKE